MYFNVEFVDHQLNRRKELIIHTPNMSEEDFSVSYPVCEHFEQWIEDAEEADWTEEQKQEHAEQCEWFFYPLDEEEVKEIESEEGEEL